jgi:hypothetical protein
MQLSAFPQLAAGRFSQAHAGGPPKKAASVHRIIPENGALPLTARVTKSFNE